MSKRKDHIYDGTLSSLSMPARVLYFLIRSKKMHDVDVCICHDKTLMSISGLGNHAYYTAKKELKENGIIDYEKHPGIKQQSIKFIHDVSINLEDITSTLEGEVDSENINTSTLKREAIPLEVEPSTLKGEDSTPKVIEFISKNMQKLNEDKSFHELPKSPSVLSSPIISIISSKDDFSRNSEEYKRAEEYLHAILIEINPKLRIAIRLQFDRIYKKLNDKEKEDLQSLYDKATESPEHPEIIKEAESIITKS